MTIGLLECDHVLPRFQHIAGDYRDMFSALFPRYDFLHFDVSQGNFPASLRDCDAFMCTGSKQSVYDELPWIIELAGFVRELHAAEKTFVGFCFGHQMAGHALGGRVEKAPGGWCVGAHTFTTERQEDWMHPQQAQFRVLMMCQDQVLDLPPDATLLASAGDCPNGLIRIGERILGLQGHPEFPVAYEQALMETRVDRIGAAKVERGLASLLQPLDSDLIVSWVEHFIARAK